MRPEPLKFDLTPDAPMFDGIHEYFDPEAERAAAEAAAQKAATEAAAEKAAADSAREFLDWLLNPSAPFPADTTP